MRMTRQQVAELLLNMDENCSNVEVYDMFENEKKWRQNETHDVENVLLNIINYGTLYRIKDNSLKEVTPALRGKWARYKDKKFEREVPIEFLNYTNQTIGVNGEVFELTKFNELCELVED